MTILLGIIFAPLLPFWAYALYRELARIRATRVADDIARIEAGFASWTDPTPPTPLRAIAWPVRQSPTDMAAVYEVVDPPPDWDAVIREARAWNWAVAKFNELVAISDEYDGLVAA